MDVLDRQDCEREILRIKELLGTGIFNSNNVGNSLHKSAFIELMICLRDLLHKCEKYAQRISFSEDILQNNYVDDVTDAITAIRDACCHTDSFKMHIDDKENRVIIFACGICNVMQIGDLELKSEYEDDIAVFYGSNRLYFKRHIVRAFEEAEKLLAPLLTPDWR